MVLAITVKNFGNTEAHVTAHSSLVVGPFETEQDAFDTAPLVTADQPDTHTVLPPGDTLQQTVLAAVIIDVSRKYVGGIYGAINMVGSFGGFLFSVSFGYFVKWFGNCDLALIPVGLGAELSGSW